MTPISQSRELGNVVRERSESEIEGGTVASGVPSEVRGSGPMRGFTTGGATLIAAVSGVVGVTVEGDVVWRLLSIEPGVWKVPGEVPGPVRFGPESCAWAVTASKAAVAVKICFIKTFLSMIRSLLTLMGQIGVAPKILGRAGP